MERRTFLGVAGAGLFVPALPTWLRAGFQEQDGHGHCPNPFVSRSLERSRQLGKPTLVFVVPEDTRERYRRRGVFGQFLNHCSRDALLDLSLCEVLCARQSDLAVHVPAAKPAANETKQPLLIHVNQVDGVRFAADALPALPENDRGWPNSCTPNFESAVRERVRALEKVAHGLLLPDARALPFHAGVIRGKLGPEELETITASLRGETALGSTLADRAAPLVRLLAPGTEGGPAALDRVVEGATFRLRKGPPYGARWGKSMGCGPRMEFIPEGHPLEGEDATMSARVSMCGMAHVPEVSQRLLTFWGDPNGGD